MIDNIRAHCTATVLDLAYQKYSVQWTKIGNMQSSASSILTVISIIASLMFGIITQVQDINKLTISLGVFIYSFYITVLFSFIYLTIASVCVFNVIKPKNVTVLQNPIIINTAIENSIVSRVQPSDDELRICNSIDLDMLLKLNDEISDVEDILNGNQKWYNRCLIASFLSLLSSFISLAHIGINTFMNVNFYITVVGTIGYACTLGIFFIFTPRSK